MQYNPLTAIDFYKSGHRVQYDEGTEYVYSNFTPRSSRLANMPLGFDEKVVFIGLQGVIKSYLQEAWVERFFLMPKGEVVAKYKRRMDRSLGEGMVSVEHIEALHDLGYLPIKIKALPEGSRVNIKVPLFTVINTKKEFFWLTNYIETALSAELWKPSTIATIAYEYRKLFVKYANITGTDLDFVGVQGHDFSCRGMSGLTDAAASGIGHLSSFIGTDSVLSIDYAEEYYDAYDDVVGVSVPATEHSVMSIGTNEDELGTIRRLVTETYPSGIVSVVSDTWDLWKVLTEYLPALKEEILARDGVTVVRPDSGDPVDIICGTDVMRLPEIYNDVDFPTWKSLVVDSMDQKFCDELVAEDPHIEDTVIWAYGDDRYKVTYAPELNRHDKTYYYVDNHGHEEEQTTFELLDLKPEDKGVISLLDETFGHTLNEKGYKVLNKVGAIYGDSITLERAEAILRKLEAKGYASSNIVFGIGSYTYQHLTRDVFGMAMKATWGQVNGEGIEISKDPITDRGEKKSAVGLLRVEKEGDDFVLYDKQTPDQESQGELKTVFEDGKLIYTTKLSTVRSKLINS